MSAEALLIILFVGLVAGWLAGQIVRGTGFGLIADIAIGIVGALIAQRGFALQTLADDVAESSRDVLVDVRNRNRALLRRGDPTKAHAVRQGGEPNVFNRGATR